MAASPEHFAWLWNLVKLAKDKGELRVMVLEYGMHPSQEKCKLTSAELAPHGVYPLQLRQAATALKYLLDSGVPPEQVNTKNRGADVC